MEKKILKTQSPFVWPRQRPATASNTVRETDHLISEKHTCQDQYASRGGKKVLNCCGVKAEGTYHAVAGMGEKGVLIDP